ncbi:hypothetical protein IC582_004626 [Cucumis melo]
MHPHALARVTEGSSFQRSCDSCTNYFPAKFRVLVDWQVGFLLSLATKKKRKRKQCWLTAADNKGNTPDQS